MKQIFFFAAFFGFFLLNSTVLNAQSTERSTLARRIRVGIPITQRAFNGLVEQAVSTMKRNNNIKAKDFVNMTRIDNTLSVNHLIKENRAIKEFKALYLPKFFRLGVSKLHAKLATGMCYYSKQYNVYFGGYPHYNSMFKIVELQQGGKAE